MGVIGLLLASFGLTILMSNTPASVTHGQAGRPYTSTWTAQKVITVCCWYSKEVGIGVSEWKVVGNVEGILAFEETWKTPSVSSEFVNLSGSRSFVADPRGSGFNPSKWLLGGIISSNTTLVFREKSIQDLQRDWSSGHRSQVGGNGGATCNGGDIDCRHVSGAYGWTDGESLGANRGSSQPVGGGIFVPLEWTVSGTVFD